MLSTRPLLRAGEEARYDHRRADGDDCTSLFLSAELVERAIALGAAALARKDPRRLGSGRPATARAWRTRAALERLTDGEIDLARLAVDVGLADQSHLCRVVRAETGTIPSALRRALQLRATDPNRERRKTWS